MLDPVPQPIVMAPVPELVMVMSSANVLVPFRAISIPPELVLINAAVPKKVSPLVLARRILKVLLLVTVKFPNVLPPVQSEAAVPTFLVMEVAPETVLKLFTPVRVRLVSQTSVQFAVKEQLVMVNVVVAEVRLKSPPKEQLERKKCFILPVEMLVICHC